MKKNILPIAIIIAGVLIAGTLVYLNFSKQPQLPVGEIVSGQILPLQEVGQKAIDYINQNILRGRATASLVNVVEENGFYKVKFSLQGNEMESYVTRDGKFFFPEVIDLTKVEPVAVEKGTTIGNFLVSSDEVCKENGKPIVYFFGSQGCPHCQWEHPIMEKVAAKFGEEIAFHNNMDSDADMDVFQKYSTGSIPTLVLGCKYFRVGSGESAGQEAEEKNLTALICELTDNQPAEICQK